MRWRRGAMALFGRQEDRVGRGEARAATSPSLPAPEEYEAHLARGSRIEGKLRFEGSVRIDGEVEGEIESRGTVWVGESAVIVAQITAGTIVAWGKITGDLHAAKKVELRAPCRLLGNIVTQNLVVEEGVLFEGHCSMTRGEAPESAEDESALYFETAEPLESRLARAD
ncbi:MAG: hypothetical protein KatS3mg076_3049 [Candidatus Binatia bacterium]|nr:MAG: hypothetical protein KatS3mg076_3049 [Candidatus Binatia bacterium]